MDVRTIAPRCLYRHSLGTTEAQEVLHRDVKALIAEHLQHIGAPPLRPAAWESATVEIVSEDTRRYIADLEDTLRKASNKLQDDCLIEHINSLLRHRA